MVCVHRADERGVNRGRVDRVCASTARVDRARATKRTSDVKVGTLGDSGRRRRGRGEDEELGARVKMETFAKDVGASLPAERRERG